MLDSIDAHQLAVLHSMQDFVRENLQFLAPIEKAWQPTDYLPDLTAEDWRERVQSFRDPAQSITDELLVVLVGDMVTEEALPSYAVSLNEIAQERHGDSKTPWSIWLRGWTAEENRHGDLLNAYLRLTGRVDMRAIEVTINHLIANGFNPRTFPDPYNGLIYTSFQERATRISHGNVGKLVGHRAMPTSPKSASASPAMNPATKLFTPDAWAGRLISTRKPACCACATCSEP